MVRMRYVFYAIVLTIILLILALGIGCEQQTSFDKFPAFSPYEALGQADIDYLDVNFGLLDYVDVDSNPTWTHEDIANAIVTWQQARMTMDAMALPDISYAMVETYAHYRPEVLIGTGWIDFDATDPTGEYAVDSNYQVAPWDEGLDGSICIRL